MSLFSELKIKTESEHNSNFYFDRLEWETQVWLKSLCELLDEKLNTLDRNQGIPIKFKI